MMRRPKHDEDLKFPRNSITISQPNGNHENAMEPEIWMINSTKNSKPNNEPAHVSDHQNENRTNLMRRTGSKTFQLLKSTGWHLLSNYFYSDRKNAQLLVDLLSDFIRYDVVREVWLIFNGKFWQADPKDNKIRNLARNVSDFLMAYSSYLEEIDPKLSKWYQTYARKAESFNSIKAMIALAKSEEQIAIRPEDLDRDPNLWNLRNGTRNSKTGEIYPHNPSDFITKYIDEDYDENAKSPIWHKFLEQSTQGNSELLHLLQTLAGYFTTGLTQLQRLIIFVGPGLGGKSTFFDVLQGLMGPYATTTERNFFAKKPSSGNGTGISDLQGFRLAVCHEHEKGRPLDVPLVKQLTGYDRIKSRGVYEKLTEFKLWTKFILVTNHLPVIDSSDFAIMRRMLIIPWNNRVAADQIDQDLGAKLRAEYPGILVWLAEGVKKYHQDGIVIPEIVKLELEKYAKLNDPFADFVEEEFLEDSYGSFELRPAYSVYRQWCEKYGYDPVPKLEFKAKLVAANIHPHLEAKEVYEGYYLKSQFQAGLYGRNSAKR